MCQERRRDSCLPDGWVLGAYLSSSKLKGLLVFSRIISTFGHRLYIKDATKGGIIWQQEEA